MEQTHTNHGELLVRAREGDHQAWSELVDSMSPIIWSIVRNFRLDQSTAKDVAQTVWMKLVENLDRIGDPNRLPGWISTTCRREAIAVVNRRNRMVPSDFGFDLEDDSPSVEDRLVEAEEQAEVLAALQTLSQSDQDLLRLMVIDPPLSYEDIAQITDRPIGSLGPTRARAIERLRRAMAATVGVG